MVAVVLSSAAGAADVTISISLEDSHRAEIDAGFAHTHAGRPAEAEAIFSKVADAYEKAYSGREVRCAQNSDDGALVAAVTLLGNPAAIKSTDEAVSPAAWEAFLLKRGDVTIVGPGWCEAIFGKAFALIDLHRLDEAEPLLARVVAMAPTRAHYLNEYAELFKAHRQWQRSFDLFALALEVGKNGPDSRDKIVKARSLRGMGYAKIELGKLDEAERLFKRSLKVQPNHAGALSELKYIADVQAKAK